MIKPSSSILTIQGLPPFGRFGFYFECGTCHHLIYVTCERAKDGTVSLDSEGDCYRLSWSRSKQYAAVIQGGKLSISCGVCRSGSTVATVSSDPVGI